MKKYLFAVLLFLPLWLLAQADPGAAVVPPIVPVVDDNVLSAMWEQIKDTPGSGFVILAVSIVAFLVEILPFVKTKYMPHFCVGAGMALYWAFVSRGSVPPTFPYPVAVLLLNGAVCGLAALTAQALLIRRFIPEKYRAPQLLLPLVLLPFLTGAGCVLFSPVAPGADPVVVNIERGQIMAESGFDTVLALDESDRGFWRTNAPAFHNFCEDLRRPVPWNADGRTTLPRYLAAQLQVSRLKQDYKAAKSSASSNAVVSAELSLKALLGQTTAWLTIVTNQPNH